MTLPLLCAFVGLAAGILLAIAGRNAIQPPIADDRKPLVPAASVQVLRVENPLLLEPATDQDADILLVGKAEMRDLFERAFANPEHADAGPVLEWCAEHAADPELAILVARRGTGPWMGLSIVADYSNPFSPHPWCLHNYGRGRDVREALGNAMGEFIASRGHDRLVAINRTGGPDARWIASHRHSSVGRVVASYGEFVWRGRNQ